ncbi:cytochrome P450 [Striga asiatica]|uniref:Cytochrome P450 n=1 Tax=Striga asiatica TaxID=4170 RepID=A0A5A7QX31_STRAF|nr:cytochrome P450 [Striga asiatica]
MVQLLLLLLLLILPIIFLHLTKNHKKSPTEARVPPGPPGFPVIGNLHHLAAASDAPHLYLHHLSKKYGPIVRMGLGPKPMLVVSSAKLAEQVMKAQDLAFCGRPKSLGQQRLSYDCSDIAFSSYDEYWREVRKITTIHLFSAKKTQFFRPVREDEMARFVARISARITARPEASGRQAVNLSEMAIELGSTLICRIAFGKRYEEGGPEMRRFDGLLKRAQAVMAAFYVSDYFPVFGWVDRLRGSNIFIAATDTSSASIVWTMTALKKAPQVDEDDLPKLSYMKAVINEVFRLYPPAPLLVPRETIEKCTLDGYEVQPKTIVYINAWAIARDPEFWEKPNEFLPERFLESKIEIKGHDFGVIPFGAGRRSCPGMFMGLVNVELTVANLLYSFDWELPRGVRVEDVDTEGLPGITVHKKNPLLLVPKRCNNVT